MCDYSLMGVQNRLAEEGEQLVTHRFGTGTIGLASVHDVTALTAWLSARHQPGMLAKIPNAVIIAKPVVCAICVPPGAKLSVNMENGKPPQEATFDQLSQRVNSYRDAIRFTGGNTTLLQNLPVGMQMTVVSLAEATEYQPVNEGQSVYAAH